MEQKKKMENMDIQKNARYKKVEIYNLDKTSFDKDGPNYRVVMWNIPFLNKKSSLGLHPGFLLESRHYCVRVTLCIQQNSRC